MRSRLTRVPVVLVVDDEPQLRVLVYEILKRRGLRALVTSSGPGALEILTRFRRSIHAVITDIQMPGMNGIELAGKIREIRPQMPILLMSGGSLRNSDELTAVLDDKVGFLEKPFEPQTLISAVNTLCRPSSP